ncbi:MAG: hypothetical protein ACRESO_08710, partial [Gammaproteobacteria bacterium]
IMSLATRLQKYAAIQQYLADKFPDSQIEQKNDFDRGAQSFKIEVTDSSLLLKIAGEFIDNNNIDEILRRLDDWNICALLGSEPGFGIMVTENGPSPFERN